MATFPSASHTFTVMPARQNTAGANPAPVPHAQRTPKATGVPIALKVSGGNAVTQDGGIVFTSDFQGTTDLKYPILSGDFLRDETENDAYGNSIWYQVNLATPNALVLKLFLSRTEIN